MKPILKRTVAAGAVVGLVAAGGTGPAQAADPGVTRNQIVIGSTTDLSGPTSSAYGFVPKAAQVYFDYVNRSGGINGRDIKFVVKDDEYNPTKTVTATNELLLDEEIFAMYGALGTANHQAVIDTLTDAEVPDVFVNTGASIFDNVRKYPMTFPYFPSYAVEAKVMAKYIEDTASLRNKKRCFMYQEGEFGDNAGQGFAAAGMTDWEAQASYLQSAARTPPIAQVSKLRNADCELVVFFGVTTAAIGTLGAAAQLGFRPTWMINSVATEPTIYQAALGSTRGKALLNGVYTPSFLTPITDVGNPYVKQMKTLVEAAGLPWNFYTYYGVNTAYVLAQALEATGRNLTRERLIDTLQTKSRSFRSAASVPFVITKRSHQGLTGFWMGRYDSSGELVRLGNKNRVYVAGNSSRSQAKVATFRPPDPTRKLLP
ncbi:MAG TPA: ABC transporter substrate-binding protein [Acidimicrobiia bacterium]